MDNNNNIVFMFSGQGSQYLTMGQGLYTYIPEFRNTMEYLDRILIKETGVSVIQKLYHPESTRAGRFDDINFTHPALFMVQYSLAKSLVNHGIHPQFLLGYSLGEYVAAAVGGILELEAAFKMVIDQARLFHNECSSGGMMAILDKPELFEEDSIFDKCNLAGVNYTSHFCIAGKFEQLRNIEEHLKERDTLMEILPVRQPFHSWLINPLKDKFLETIRHINPKRGNIPIISSMDIHQKDSYSREDFWNVVRHPIQFYRAILSFNQTLIAKQERAIFIDLGPSGTLASFIKNGLRVEHNQQVFAIMSLFSGELKRFRNLTSHLTHSNADLI